MIRSVIRGIAIRGYTTIKGYTAKRDYTAIRTWSMVRHLGCSSLLVTILLVVRVSWSL